LQRNPESFFRLSALRLGRITGIFFLALLAFVALLPGPVKGRIATSGLAHECSHIAVFSLAFLLTAAGSKRMRESAVLVFLLFAFRSILEFMQTQVYGIPIEYRDISANAAGLLVGFLSRTIWRANAAQDELEL